jgi:quinone-modifying oxidoreductase subunit QmoC
MFVIILGYIESAVIFVITAIFILGRMTKNKEVSKHAHPSDWFFVIWLFLMGLTAFIVRLFVDLEILKTNIWIYLVHMIILVQWALIIVPFGKWTHFLFRSFAMYFDKIKLLSAKN